MTNKLEPFQKIFKLCYKESQKERPTISIIKKIIKDHYKLLIHYILLVNIYQMKVIKSICYKLLILQLNTL